MPLSAEAREERASWLRLCFTDGVGPVTARRLLEAFGLPEQVFAAGRAKLAAALDPRLAQALLGDDAERDAAVERALDWARADDHHLITLADPAYPRQLLAIGDPPPVLFVAGDPARLARPALAIVGSRSATHAGMEHAESFARELGAQGLCIVSGLASGIDAAAHRGALGSAGGTVAVIGTGIDRVYPPANRPLARAIAADGAIVSELPLGTGVARANFPRRNRLIAGLSLGVLVVEAARQSGSLITARQAAEFGREVMAIPGSIHSPVARGCHQLIREGAKLVECAEDVLAELPGWRPAVDAGTGAATGTAAGIAAVTAAGTAAGAGAGAEMPPGAGSPAAADPDSPAHAALLEALGWDPAGADELAERAGLDAAQAAAGLLELELAGRIERLIDGRYARARA